MIIPKGWKLVPVKPTEEMLDAWFTAPRGDSGSVQDFSTAYAALLAAAPTAPAGEPECGCCGRSDQCDPDCDAYPAPDERERLKRAIDAPDQIAMAAAFPLKHDPLAVAADEREIAAGAIEAAIDAALEDDRWQEHATPSRLIKAMGDYARGLRAGKEGEPS